MASRGCGSAIGLGAGREAPFAVTGERHSISKHRNRPYQMPDRTSPRTTPPSAVEFKGPGEAGEAGWADFARQQSHVRPAQRRNTRIIAS
jgi:hypothetical protein